MNMKKERPRLKRADRPSQGDVENALEEYFARVGRCEKCGMPLDEQHDELNCHALADLGDDGKEKGR